MEFFLAIMALIGIVLFILGLLGALVSLIRDFIEDIRYYFEIKHYREAFDYVFHLFVILGFIILMVSLIIADSIGM